AEEDRENISAIRNRELIARTYSEQDTTIVDFYTGFDPLAVTSLDREEYEKYRNSLNDEEREVLDSDKTFYELTCKNIGGLVMPIILEFTFDDGTSEVLRIPAEIWCKDYEQVSKVFSFEKEVVEIALDPFLETADTDTNNNYYPSESKASRIDLFKQRDRSSGENLMQRDRRAQDRSGSN
ncbi:MAG: M1 family peptidase, partial [Saprospiraceae bacterium]